MRFATHHRRAHSHVMYLRILTIAVVAFSAGCSTPAQQPARKPGFLERAWTSTRKGTSAVWETTKSGADKGWHSTKNLVSAPFSGSKSKSTGSKYRQLETSIQIKPDVIYVASTRSIEATVLVTNKAAQSLQFNFPTSQHIEVVVKTEDGKVIQRWSEDQRIEREASFVVINPNERLEYSTTVSTRNMKAGKTYVIEASVPGYDAVFARKVVVPQG